MKDFTDKMKFLFLLSPSLEEVVYELVQVGCQHQQHVVVVVVDPTLSDREPELLLEEPS